MVAQADPRTYVLIHLAAWRKACHLSILHLACLTGIHEETLRSFERGTPASLDDAALIAELLGCPVDAASLYDPEYANEVPQRWAHAGRVRLGARKVDGIKRVTVYCDYLNLCLKPWNHWNEDAPTVYQLAEACGIPLARVEAIVDLAPCTFAELETIAAALDVNPLRLITQDFWQ